VITMTIVNASKFKKAIEKAAQDLKDATAAALYQQGGVVMADSVKMCPFKFGRLRGSHYVTLPEYINGNPFIEVGYGVYYAPWVHEMLSTTNWTAPNTGSKYLQRAVDAHIGSWIQDMAWLTKKNLESGRKLGGTHPTRPKE
jgi:hypothetical protein